MVGNEGLPNTKQELLRPELRSRSVFQCFRTTPLFVIGLLYGLYIRIKLRRDDESEDAATGKQRLDDSPALHLPFVGHNPSLDPSTLS
jgi:hypothetical protein